MYTKEFSYSMTSPAEKHTLKRTKVSCNLENTVLPKYVPVILMGMISYSALLWYQALLPNNKAWSQSIMPGENRILLITSATVKHDGGSTMLWEILFIIREWDNGQMEPNTGLFQSVRTLTTVPPSQVKEHTSISPHLSLQTDCQSLKSMLRRWFLPVGSGSSVVRPLDYRLQGHVFKSDHCQAPTPEP